MPRKPTKKSPGPELIRGMKQLAKDVKKRGALPTCERPTLGTPYDSEQCGKPAYLHDNGKWYCHEHRPFKVKPCKCERDYVNDDEHKPDCKDAKIVAAGSDAMNRMAMQAFEKRESYEKQADWNSYHAGFVAGYVKATFFYLALPSTGDEGRIKKVRKLCESYIAYAKSICMEEYQQGYKSALVEVLDILNTTPTAKGPR